MYSVVLCCIVFHTDAFVLLSTMYIAYVTANLGCKRLVDYFLADELESYIIHCSKENMTNDNEIDNNNDYIMIMSNTSMGWLKNNNNNNNNKQDAKSKNMGNNIKTTKVAVVDDTIEENHIEMTSVSTTMDDNNTATKSINRSIYTLCNINIKIKRGQLLAVVGGVGSGKSSLLNGMLGELWLQNGQIKVNFNNHNHANNSSNYKGENTMNTNTNTNIAYCEQKPWILNDTVMGNILFGQKYDKVRDMT
jgi:ABC-type multidrug transport system fused ATPase/permease subunit